MPSKLQKSEHSSFSGPCTVLKLGDAFINLANHVKENKNTPSSPRPSYSENARRGANIYLFLKHSVKKLVQALVVNIGLRRFEWEVGQNLSLLAECIKWGRTRQRPTLENEPWEKPGSPGCTQSQRWHVSAVASNQRT